MVKKRVAGLDPQKVKAITTAAIKEFAQHGYLRGNTDQIAQQAGVSKGTVFHYFHNKQQLFVAAFNAAYDRIMANANFDVWRESTDLSTMVTGAAAYKMQLEQQYPAEFKLLIGAFSEIENFPENLKHEIQKSETQAFSLARGFSDNVLQHMHIRQDIPADIVSEYVQIMLGAIQNYTTNYLAKHPDIQKIEQMDQIIAHVKQMIDLFEHGIVAK